MTETEQIMLELELIHVEQQLLLNYLKVIFGEVRVRLGSGFDTEV